MKNDVTNIPDNSNKDAEQEKLLQYLNGEMSDAEQHEFEKSMQEDVFTEDALEGLEQFQHKKVLNSLAEQMNLQLKKEVVNRNRKRKRMAIPSQQWTYYSIVLIILIAIITYMVIKKM